MKRRTMVFRSCGLGSFAALALSGAALGDFVFFTDPGEFFAALEAQNKLSDGSWDFDPNNVGPGFIGAFRDPLNYLTVDDIRSHLTMCCRRTPSCCIPIFSMTRPDAGLRAR